MRFSCLSVYGKRVSLYAHRKLYNILLGNQIVFLYNVTLVPSDRMCEDLKIVNCDMKLPWVEFKFKPLAR